jgi:ATP-binding cassette, subfamily B, bacterial MsbA
MNELKSIRIFSPLLKIYPRAIVSIVILGFLSSLCEGLGITLFIPLLQSIESAGDRIHSNNSWIDFLDRLFSNISPDERLTIIALFIFASILFKNILSYGNNLLFAWFNARIGHHLRKEIFSQFLNVSYSFLEENESGKLINTLATETWRTTQALGVAINLVICLVTILVFTILLLLISWKLTIAVAAGLGLISILIQLVTRQVKYLGRKAVEANKNLASRMWEGFSGMKVIRAFAREKYEQKRFERSSQKVLDSFFKLDLLSGVVNPLSEVLSAALLLGIMAIAFEQNDTTLPSLLTFIFILYRLQPKVKQLDSSRVALASFISSVEDVMSLIDKSDKPYIRSGNKIFNGLQQAICLESVSFAYRHSDKLAIEDISFCIPKGKTTALVGSSGAGKSTSIGLICRFYELTEGEIYVDGCPLRELNLDSWRNRIAVVSQDVYLFSTTIRENIAYGRLEATEAEIIEAAKLANAHQFISQFPDGYDTKIGDRGMRLSGGQRQRIALARAIVRNPEILILDEATNALDSISENLIQEALNTFSQNCTVIAIAHRLSTIEQADRIIVLDRGRVIEQGSFQELLKQQGLFARLHSLQYRTVQTEVN